MTDDSHANRRPDEVVSGLFGIPPARASELVDAGAVFADKRRIDAETRLRPGQTLRTDLSFVPPNMPELEPLVLLRDRDVIALDKPAGMPSVATWTAAAGSLHRAIVDQALCTWEPLEVHRLDAPTSGVIVFARRGKSQAKLAEAFKCGQVRKVYWARVHGDPWAGRDDREPFVVDAPMRRNPRDNRRWEVAPADARRGGKHGTKRALTEIRSLASGATDDGRPWCDVEVHPKTGRTHQIRVHLASLGTPVVGDFHYGDPDADRAVGSSRLWLHAATLELKHPRSGQRITLRAPTPDSMVGFAAP